MPGEPPRRRSGRSLEASGNGRPRGMAIAARAGARIRATRRAGQNPAYAPSGAAPPRPPQGSRRALAMRHRARRRTQVDGSADRIGTDADFCGKCRVSRGKPCGSNRGAVACCRHRARVGARARSPMALRCFAPFSPNRFAWRVILLAIGSILVPFFRHSFPVEGPGRSPWRETQTR